MFKTVNARVALRTGVATALAVLAALGTALTDGTVSPTEWVAVATAGFGAVALWLGVGATTPTEPFLGVEGPRVEVPVERVTPT